MATAVVKCRTAVIVRFKNITGVLGYLKCDGIVKSEPIRYHHVASDTWRNCVRRMQYRKSFITCSRGNQRGLLGIAVARSVSTVVAHDDHGHISKFSESDGSTVKSVVSEGPRSSLVPAEGTTSSSVVGEIVPPAPSLEQVRVPPEVVASETVAPLGNIPDPPTVPLEVELAETLPLSGEPSFASLGLGGWSPVGIVQNCMEYLHIGCDLPWWISIVIGTAVVRILIFPIVIMSQRNSAKMSNNLPQLQVLQLKMTEARQTGNQLEAARYAQELSSFMKEKDLNPFKNIVVPLAQAPLFISFFMGLRGMANVPVESMRTGGLFWFSDLTVPDQYYLMPIITSFTMWITIEVGTDTAKLSAANLQTMKYVLRAMPVFILPFTVGFPGAILMYWVSTNFISLVQVGFLRIPAVREFFKIEKMVTHTPDSLPVKPKGFVKGLQESWTNMKITKELEDRHRYDELQFQRAGRGPIQKTYKYDPTQPRSINSTGKDAIAAKKSDR
ncbi:mitochondrial inner membrane protein OXA1L [Zootermopsis nevadensis]|uniref:Mitochondrial inner membrane protein OXA1L n=1 Tax=Zootermopsis nevadensis TaxID=136037 RepID=A0A067QXY9_ZOONE|nr:mitochondrial inner membrane protein OXA1L [Zootermopsis nevadensis]KDR14241.1 Mitochondrial inner membrane protein OXA1L [Zootermopsis nevadensis]